MCFPDPFLKPCLFGSLEYRTLDVRHSDLRWYRAFANIELEGSVVDDGTWEARLRH